MGVFQYVDGDRYEGQYSEGMMHGFGVYTWAADDKLFPMVLYEEGPIDWAQYAKLKATMHRNKSKRARCKEYPRRSRDTESGGFRRP